MIVLMVDVEPEYSLQILNKLIEIRDIILATKTIGDYDLIAIGVTRDFEHLYNLILKVASIPYVRNIEVSFWVQNMKIHPEYFTI